MYLWQDILKLKCALNNESKYDTPTRYYILLIAHTEKTSINDKLSNLFNKNCVVWLGIFTRHLFIFRAIRGEQ